VQEWIVRGGERFWGVDTGPNPTDRGKNGSKHHLLGDGKGIPLNCSVSAANDHDVTPLLILVATMRLVVRRSNGEQRVPKRLWGDRGDDSEGHREIWSLVGIDPELAKRNSEHGSGLGKERYVVEQTIAAIHQNRRLKVR
jgi:hypothetical protein